MAFTSKLGTSDSLLGNILLGIGSDANIFTGDADDTLTLTDLAVCINLHGHATDTLTFSDLMVGFTVSGASVDSLTFTDSMSPAGSEFHRSFTSTLTFTEVIFNTKFATCEDDLTFDDECDGFRKLDFTAPDTVTFAELLSREFTGNRFISEGLDFVELCRRNIIRQTPISETLTLIENMIGVRARVTSDTLVFADVFDNFVSKLIRDLIEFDGQFFCNALFGRLTNDVFEMFDIIGVELFMRLNTSDSVTFTDSILANRVTPLSDTFVFTDTTVGVASKKLADGLTLIDNATFSFIKTVTAEDVIVFDGDNLQVNLEVRRDLAETVIFEDMMRAVRWKFGSFTDTVTFTDELHRQVHVIILPDSLIFAEALTYQKIGVGNPADTLSLMDTVFVNTVTSQTVSDTLKFVEFRPTNNEPNSSIPLPGIPTNPSPGDPPPPDIPSGTYGTVANKMMIFIGQSRSVVMVPPEFNDYVSDRNQTIFKRKMDGAVSTFIKTAPDEKLHWEFIVAKPKADEFRAFLDAENGRAFTVYDWEGHVWAAKLLTDTIDKEEIGRWEPIGNKTRIVVELLGRRYA